MAQSRSTWKRLERKTAKEIGGQRSGNKGKAAADAYNDWLTVECKSWAKGPKRVLSALRQAENEAGDTKIPVARIHELGCRGDADLVVMRWGTFAKLVLKPREDDGNGTE